MSKGNFALRLQPSLLDEARKLAEAEGVALSQLINVAVAEKLSALGTGSYFQARAAHPRRWKSFAGQATATLRRRATTRRNCGDTILNAVGGFGGGDLGGALRSCPRNSDLHRVDERPSSSHA